MTAKELYLLAVKHKVLVPDSAENTFKAAMNAARELTRACHYEWGIIATRGLAKIQIETFGIGAICGAGALLVAKKVHDARIKRKENTTVDQENEAE